MHIPVAPQLVFEALNTAEGRASFWAESAVEANGYVEFRFSNGETFRSRIVERNEPEVFALDYFGGVARFDLKPNGRGGTDLLLTHTGITDNENWMETHAGWLNVLFPLKAWLTHGVDLRNHDPERSWDRGYADQ